MITTRDRLLEAGMELIARSGFKATTVGDIEAAAGLVPRAGALYKHFDSKQALIEAALQARIDRVESLSSLVDFLRTEEATADKRGALVAIGRAILDELDREELVSRIIEKDGDRFPELRERMRAEMVEPGFRFTAEAIGWWLDDAGPPVPTTEIDVPATASVVLGAVVNHRRHHWMFGRPPSDVDDDRFLAAWADLTVKLFPTDREEENP